MMLLSLGLPLFSGCDDVDTTLKAPTYSTALKEDETRISVFEKDFPLQYASYMKRMSGIHIAIPVFSKGYRPKQGKVVP